MWIVYTLIANAGIFWLERFYTINHWTPTLALTALCAIALSQFGLWKMFATAPSLLMAGVLFTIINQTARLYNAHSIGQSLGWNDFVGVGLLIIGLLTIKLL